MLKTDSVSVTLHATDTISRAGVAAALRTRPEVRIVEPDELAGESVGDLVSLVVTERLDATANQLLRRLQCRGHAKAVLVVGMIDDAELLTVVGAGVCAVLRRSEATPEALVRLIKAVAAGEGALPPDMLGRLLNRVSRLQRKVLQPNGWDLAGISERETEVLRLVADGFDTREIAERLCYSQRTVKSILHDITNRFQLRNRSHAVAFALREGLI
jgi:DNA-binding NarL/FixJ family response regulator